MDFVFETSGTDLSHDILHDAALVPKHKPRNLILRPTITTTQHLHPKPVIPRLHSRSTRSHKSSRKLREHRTLSNQPG